MLGLLVGWILHGILLKTSLGKELVLKNCCKIEKQNLMVVSTNKTLHKNLRT